MNTYRHYTFLLLTVFCISGCTRQSPEKETTVSGLEENSAISFAERFDVALAQKENWRKHWQEHVGSFSSYDFKLIMTDTLDQYEMPEKNPIALDDPLAPYQIPHPTGNGVIDIYSYKIESQDEEGRPYLNPDAEVVWYKEDGMKKRLLFMGPSGMFEEASWLNENELLVLGFFQDDEGFRPMAWVIELEGLVLRQYSLNKVTTTYPMTSYLDQKIKPLTLR